MRSLRAQLLMLWLLSLLACVVLGVLMVQLYDLSSTARVGRAEAVVARACDLIRGRYAFYLAGWRGSDLATSDPKVREGLTAATTLALRWLPEIEGGVWQNGVGSIAYAYPTYPGDGPKTDLPAAEQPRIKAVNEQATRDDQYTSRLYPSPSETLLVEACPLPGPMPGLTGWAMTRVRTSQGFGRLGTGLGILAVLVVGGAAWLSALVISWSRQVHAIEVGLYEAGAAEQIPTLPPTGSRELDRIVDALNDAGRRLTAQRQRSDELAAQVAAAERMAALGRVAAGLAHEIRNPLTAMRLQAENALVSADPNNPRRALADMLDQIARLNGLVSELLAMTQHRTPAPVRLDLSKFLTSVIQRHEGEAARDGVSLELKCGHCDAWFDPEIVGRVLDNLLLNALYHTPRGGLVQVVTSTDADAIGEHLRVVITDSGRGVQRELRNNLFEPFVTGRSDGTGLGLAIARELAIAHGGALHLLHAGGETSGQGAAFALDLPWGCDPALTTEPQCPPS